MIKYVEIIVECDKCGAKQRFGFDDNCDIPKQQSSGVERVGINGKLSEYVELYAQHHGWYNVNPTEQYCFNCIRKGLEAMEVEE